MNWYCIVNGTQRGPMTLGELRGLVQDGTLKVDDYVWHDSFGEQWQRVREVRELVLPPGGSLAAGGFVAPPAQPLPHTPLTGVHGNRPFFSLAMKQSWARMSDILFHNTSFVRWMGMAFCVWVSIVGLHEPNLAGEALLQRTQPDAMELRSKIESCTTGDQMMTLYGALWSQTVEKARQILTPVVVKTALILWLLLTGITCWLRARGAFMVMHRWHHPDASIAESWSSARGLGRQLFLFRLGIGTVTCALLAAIGFDLQLHVITPLTNGAAYEGDLALRGFLLVLALSLVLTVWLTVVILVTHFVVPIMYWRCASLLEAGRAVVEFCNEHPGAMTIYFTMYIILLHVALAVLAVAACCTCCCASYLCIIPFVNGILFLPATIFFRGLGISFLRQWRPDLETAVGPHGEPSPP